MTEKRQEFTTGEDRTRLAQAFEMAEWLHKKQTRKQPADAEYDAIPYLTHLTEVLALMMQGGATEDQLIAGLLHDALEDQPVTPNHQVTRDLILDTFGPEVLSLVVHCTDGVPGESGHKAPFAARKIAHIQHIDAAATQDPDFLLVTLCDKLSNAQSIVHDEHIVGARIWERFNNDGDPRRTAWYYRMMLEVIRKHATQLPKAQDLITRLDRYVGELDSAAARAAADAGRTGDTGLPATLDGTLEAALA